MSEPIMVSRSEFPELFKAIEEFVGKNGPGSVGRFVLPSFERKEELDAPEEPLLK